MDMSDKESVQEASSSIQVLTSRSTMERPSIGTASQVSRTTMFRLAESSTRRSVILIAGDHDEGKLQETDTLLTQLNGFLVFISRWPSHM